MKIPQLLIYKSKSMPDLDIPDTNVLSELTMKILNLDD